MALSKRDQEIVASFDDLRINPEDPSPTAVRGLAFDRIFVDVVEVRLKISRDDYLAFGPISRNRIGNGELNGVRLDKVGWLDREALSVHPLSRARIIFAARGEGAKWNDSLDTTFVVIPPHYILSGILSDGTVVY